MAGINWARIDPLIGTMPDSQLAAQSGVSHTTIANRRRKLGITQKAPQRESSIPWELYDDRLGSEPDTEIARDVGCSKHAVRRRREERGISAYGGTPRRSRAPEREQSLSRYASLVQSAEITGYSTGYLAQLCRDAGEDGSLIPAAGVRRLGGEWEILRSLLPDLARRKGGNTDGRLYIVDVAQHLKITHQRASALFRSRRFAIFQEPGGRRYTTLSELDKYVQRREP